MVGDEWVRAAMTDDAVVVELLVRLKQSQASSSSSPKSWPRALVPLRWGLRQPRSRPRCDAVLRRKEADSTRCSPTTPLSWSGGAPPSPTTDGFEASSGPASRSKVLSLSLSLLLLLVPLLPVFFFAGHLICDVADFYLWFDRTPSASVVIYVCLRSGGNEGFGRRGLLLSPSTRHSFIFRKAVFGRLIILPLL